MINKQLLFIDFIMFCQYKICIDSSSQLPFIIHILGYTQPKSLNIKFLSQQNPHNPRYLIVGIPYLGKPVSLSVESVDLWVVYVWWGLSLQSGPRLQVRPDKHVLVILGRPQTLIHIVRVYACKNSYCISGTILGFCKKASTSRKPLSMFSYYLYLWWTEDFILHFTVLCKYLLGQLRLFNLWTLYLTFFLYKGLGIFSFTYVVLCNKQCTLFIKKQQLCFVK